VPSWWREGRLGAGLIKRALWVACEHALLPGFLKTLLDPSAGAGSAPEERTDPFAEMMHDMLVETPELAEALMRRSQAGARTSVTPEYRDRLLALLTKMSHAESLSHAEHEAAIMELQALDREPCFWAAARDIVLNHPDPTLRVTCARELYERVIAGVLLDPLSFQEKQSQAAAIVREGLARLTGRPERGAMEAVLYEILGARDPWTR